MHRSELLALSSQPGGRNHVRIGVKFNVVNPEFAAAAVDVEHRFGDGREPPLAIDNVPFEFDPDREVVGVEDARVNVRAERLGLLFDATLKGRAPVGIERRPDGVGRVGHYLSVAADG